MKQAWSNEGKEQAEEVKGVKSAAIGDPMTVEDIEEDEASKSGALASSTEAVQNSDPKEEFSTPVAPAAPGRVSTPGVIPTSDDSYHTPVAEEKAKLSASLRAGTYDAGAHILRTCSLPNLASLAEDEGEYREGEASADKSTPREEEEEEEEEEEGEGEEGRENLEERKEKKGFFEEMEEVGEKSEEGEEGGSGEEEKKVSGSSENEDESSAESGDEWSSSEEEDLQRLVQTLQSFVEEASKFLSRKFTSLQATPFCRISLEHQVSNVSEHFPTTTTTTPGRLARLWYAKKD